MTNSRYPEITDELLSAYIDNAVTERERQLVERAVAEDADIAWRLTTLQETVRLLRTLPPVRLPRSFALTPEQAAQGRALPALPRGVAVAAPVETPPRTARSGFWEQLAESWGRFWRAGSPALRNAMATSMALLFALIILPLALSPASTRFAAQERSATLAAPVAQLPAPSVDRAAGAEAPAPAPETAASKLAPASEADAATMDEAAAEPAAPESEVAQAESLASPAEQSVASVPAGEHDTAPPVAAQAVPAPAMREGAGAAGAPEMGLMPPSGVVEGYPGEAQQAAPPGVAEAIPPEAFGPAAAPAFGEAPAAAIVTRATPTTATSAAVAAQPETPEDQLAEAAAAEESVAEEPALAASTAAESPSASAASAEVAVAGALVAT
ncbi:MAG: zf-HC2 domain-containing protein, partial [Caldilineaceae bacterium]|nr:zf-HC2 domain-containing protein [Caldilineaceae bacterium]